MERTEFKDSFKLFPYRADKENGRTNNGGVDLLLEPHRISEIHEAIDFIALKNFIASSSDGECPYYTLGCDSGFLDNVFQGYVEFSFKSPDLFNNVEFVSNLDNMFFSWFESQCDGDVSLMKGILKWEYSSYQYHGISERLKIAFYYRAPDQSYAGQILGLVQDYLNNHACLS